MFLKWREDGEVDSVQAGDKIISIGERGIRRVGESEGAQALDLTSPLTVALARISFARCTPWCLFS